MEDPDFELVMEYSDSISRPVYREEAKAIEQLRVAIISIDGPMDEVLKDADVIHHCMNDLSKEIKEKEQVRFQNLCEEFGM